MKRHGCLLITILLFIIMMITQGCQIQPLINASSEDSDISKDDLDMVNEFIKEIDSNEISIEAAKAMNQSLIENSQTKEIKSDWQFLVDYVRNEKSDKPISLDYSIEFDDDSVTMRLENLWEKIGG